MGSPLTRRAPDDGWGDVGAGRLLLDTLYQLLSDLVHTIKICTMVLQLVNNNKLCQLLSDLVNKIKICSPFIQLVHKNKLCKLLVQLVHKMQIATHCGHNSQTTCQTQVSSDQQFRPHSLLKIDFSTLTRICRVSKKSAILGQGPTNKYETEVWKMWHPLLSS